MSLRDAFKKTHVRLYTAAAISGALGLYGSIVGLPNAQAEFNQVVDTKAIRNECREGFAKEFSDRVLPVSFEYGPHISPQMMEQCVTEKQNEIFNGLKVKHLGLPLAALILSYGVLKGGRHFRQRQEHMAAPALKA